MKLYHISEEKNITTFSPRKSYRYDMQDTPPVVWAVNQRCLPNFLMPRDCPRVTYHVAKNTTSKDINRHISSSECTHVVAIEKAWFNQMLETTLYIYEFNSENFYLQDPVAGYYISESEEVPIHKHVINNAFDELLERQIEVRVLPELWKLANEIKSSTFNWSLCRMKNAQKTDVLGVR